MKKLLVMPMLLLASVAHGAWEETVPAPSGDDTVMINNIASPPGDTSQFTAFKNFPVSTPAQSALDDKEPLKGANDNYVTDAEKTAIGNLSGTNTGDQDLSGLAEKANVLELDNTDAFTPDADYEPATKKYVDDNAGGGSTPIVQTVRPTLDGGSTDEVPSEAAVGDALVAKVTLVEVEESDLTFTGAIDATNAKSFLTGLITLGHSGSDFTNTIAPQSGNYTNNWQTEFGDYPGRVPNVTSVGTDGSINGLLTSFTGTFALPQTAVGANACVSSAAYQDTASGIVAGDVVNANYNSTVSGKTGYGALATDGLKVNAVAGAGSITFEVCNVTDSSITPDAISVNWQVIK